MSNSLMNRLRNLLGADSPIDKARRSDAAPEPSEPLASLGPLALLEADRLRDEGRLDEAVSILRQLPTTDEPDVARRLGILLYLQGQVAKARRVFESLLQQVPDDPASLKFLCGCLSALGEVGLAIRTARQAVTVSPRDAQLRNALGAMLVDEGAIEEAITHFQAALEINPADLAPLVNLEILNARFGAAGFMPTSSAFVVELRARTIAALAGKLTAGQLSLSEADTLCTLTNNHADTFHIAQEIESRCALIADLPVGLMINLAVVCQNAGDLGRALDYYDRAETLEPGRTDVRNGLGALYIYEGGSRWLEGWHRACDTYRALNPRNYPNEVPQWTGQALRSGRLLVHFDQGVGDAVLGFRFLERLAATGVKVVLWLPPAMSGLEDVARPFAEVVVSALRPDARTLGCSFACGLLELIAPLAIPVEEIGSSPRLTLPDALLHRWRDRLADLSGRRIGLATLGNPHRVDDWLRSVPLNQLAPLSAMQDVSWINFAVDQRPERGALIERFGAQDLAAELGSFADTAAALGQLDLLITVDCSVAHLAGAVGTPFWLFKPTMLDWRWQIGGQLSPWWPDTRVFKADSPGHWTDAVNQMTSLLEAGVATRSTSRGLGQPS